MPFYSEFQLCLPYRITDHMMRDSVHSVQKMGFSSVNEIRYIISILLCPSVSERMQGWVNGFMGSMRRQVDGVHDYIAVQFRPRLPG